MCQSCSISDIDETNSNTSFAGRHLLSFVDQFILIIMWRRSLCVYLRIHAVNFLSNRCRDVRHHFLLLEEGDELTFKGKEFVGNLASERRTASGSTSCDCLSSAAPWWRRRRPRRRRPCTLQLRSWRRRWRLQKKPRRRRRWQRRRSPSRRRSRSLRLQTETTSVT